MTCRRRSGRCAGPSARRRCVCGRRTSRSRSTTGSPGTSPARPTMSSCGATTACRPTTSLSWSTTPPRVSTASSGETTCCRRRRGRSTSSDCSACGSVRYVHVPLVVGDDGQRLAKRHGAVTLEDLAAEGVAVERVVALGRARGSVDRHRCRSGTDPALRPATLLVVTAGTRLPAAPRMPLVASPQWWPARSVSPLAAS